MVRPKCALHPSPSMTIVPTVAITFPVAFSVRHASSSTSQTPLFRSDFSPGDDSRKGSLWRPGLVSLSASLRLVSRCRCPALGGVAIIATLSLSPQYISFVFGLTAMTRFTVYPAALKVIPTTMLASAVPHTVFPRCGRHSISPSPAFVSWSTVPRSASHTALLFVASRWFLFGCCSIAPSVPCVELGLGTHAPQSAHRFPPVVLPPPMSPTRAVRVPLWCAPLRASSASLSSFLRGCLASFQAAFRASRSSSRSHLPGSVPCARIPGTAAV